jgi:hypothetical protein
MNKYFRLLQHAVKTRDPAAVRAATQAFGHAPDVALALVKIGVQLSQPSGGEITAAQRKVIQAAYPEHAAFAGEMCDAINREAPGQRASRYVAAITGDRASLNDRLHERSQMYHDFEGMLLDATTHEYAETINSRRGESDAKPFERDAPDPTSARAIIESMLTGGNAAKRDLEDGTAGDPYAAARVRNRIADNVDAGMDTLADGSASLRESVAAALDVHTGTHAAEVILGKDTDDDRPTLPHWENI